MDGTKDEIISTTDSLVSFRSLSLSMLLSIAAWFLEGFGLWIIISASGGSIEILNTIFVFSASSIAGALSFLPGGLGVTEGSMVALLNIETVGKSLATQSTILIRLLTLWFAAFLGLIVYTSGKIFNL